MEWPARKLQKVRTAYATNSRRDTPLASGTRRTPGVEPTMRNKLVFGRSRAAAMSTWRPSSAPALSMSTMRVRRAAASESALVLCALVVCPLNGLGPDTESAIAFPPLSGLTESGTESACVALCVAVVATAGLGRALQAMSAPARRFTARLVSAAKVRSSAHAAMPSLSASGVEDLARFIRPNFRCGKNDGDEAVGMA